MTLKIRQAAVLGAGVMGAQLAAHLAAAGVRTHLLDLSSTEPPKDPAQAKLVGKRHRSARAVLAAKSLESMKPPALLRAGFAANIVPGNFDDDWGVLGEVDWIIEAVVERLDIKQSLLKRVAETVRPGVPVTTNTSGISLQAVADGLPEAFQRQFFGTHFFNPPRYMHLVEIIPHPRTEPGLLAALSAWIDASLGKGLVTARDTVNFIANRIGVFSSMAALRHMADLDLSVETVDALTGKLMGRPSSATFRTLDIVGLDTFLHVARNTYDRATDDPYREYFRAPAWLEELVTQGSLGQKTKDTGCYRKTKDETGKTAILAYRPGGRTYEPQRAQDFPWQREAGAESSLVGRLAVVLRHRDPGAEYVWRVLRDSLSYSALLLEEIAGGRPKPVDEAMRWGFNWEQGPFEIWQGLGCDTLLERMRQDGVRLPAWAKPGLAFYRPDPAAAAEQLEVTSTTYSALPRPAHQIDLPRAQNREDRRVVLANRSASLVDVGDGVACLTFHSKMNSIDADIIEAMRESVKAVSQRFDALIIGNDGEAFSAGANLKQVLDLVKQGDFTGLDKMVRGFQDVNQMLKLAPFPVVACPHGLTLGGGCEVTLHAHRVLAAAETYAGLVEIGVGLLPAGGGTKELALRAYELTDGVDRADPMPFLSRAFVLIGMAKVSSSGFDAVDIGLLPPTTTVSISREHQINRAKQLALGMHRAGFTPRQPKNDIRVLGDPGIQTFRLMLYNMVEGRQITPYDAFIGERIATVLCGGEIDPGQTVSEQYLLDLERRLFLDLCRQPKTAERIESMLKTGKPLRN